jgi:hypothetical protein
MQQKQSSSGVANRSTSDGQLGWPSEEMRECSRSFTAPSQIRVNFAVLFDVMQAVLHIVRFSQTSDHRGPLSRSPALARPTPGVRFENLSDPQIRSTHYPSAV